MNYKRIHTILLILTFCAALAVNYQVQQQYNKDMKIEVIQRNIIKD